MKMAKKDVKGPAKKAAAKKEAAPKKYTNYPTILDHSSEAQKEWAPWVRQGLWDIKGYRIVKGPAGGGTVEESKKNLKEFMVIDRSEACLYSHSYGLVSPFFLALLEGKLKGTKCPNCGTVYCPPRAHCWNPACKAEETVWMDMPLRGVIHTFTVQCLAAAPFEHMLPFSLGWVQVEGADTAICTMLHIPYKDIFIGQKVRLEFHPRKERKGDLMDMFAVAVPGQTIPKWAVLQSDKKQLKKLDEATSATLQFIKNRHGLDNSRRGW
jgi:uncharacterized protein